MIIFGIWQRLANIKHRYGLFLVWKVQDLPCDTPTCDGWSLRSCPLCLWTSNPRGAPRPQSLQTQFSEQTFLYALASLYFFRHGPRSWRVSYKLSDRPARAEPHSARNSPDRRMWEGRYQLLRSTDAPEQMRLLILISLYWTRGPSHCTGCCFLVSWLRWLWLLQMPTQYLLMLLLLLILMLMLM